MLLNVLELMTKFYTVTLDKYIARNRDRAFLLWILSNKEYQLTLSKRQFALTLRAYLQERANPIYDYDLEKRTQDEELGSACDEPESTHSENIYSRHAVASEPTATPVRRSQSANAISESGYNDDTLSILAVMGKQQQRLRSLMRANSTLNGFPHSKGSYDDLLKTCMENMKYLDVRERQVVYMLQNLGAYETEAKYIFTRKYREHLLIIIERMLCMLNFDRLLYERKHCSQQMRQYYSITDCFAKLNEDVITDLERQLRKISAHIFMFEPVRHLQYVRMYNDYENAITHFTRLSGGLVAQAFIDDLQQWQKYLCEEFNCTYDNGDLRALAARATEKAQRMPTKPNECQDDVTEYSDSASDVRHRSAFKLLGEA